MIILYVCICYIPVLFEFNKILFIRRSRNDIDLEFSYTFINSISCLHLPAFKSQAAIVSDPLFPIEKPKLQNMTLP